jgi:hypothetical protein
MKITKLALWIFLVVVLALPAADLFASEMRCGSRLVSVGDYKYDVLNKCGEPDHVEVREEVRSGRDLYVSGPVIPEGQVFRRSPSISYYVTIEEWHYNLGGNRFIRYLTFENGRLIKIATGDYGY